MTPRCSREMDALLSKMAAQLGPLEKWSAEALEALDSWMADLRLDINDQILARDNEGVARDFRQTLHSVGAKAIG